MYAHALHHAPLAVRCRWRNCHARIGEPCTLGAAYHLCRKVDLGNVTDEQRKLLVELVDLVQLARRNNESMIVILAAEQRVTAAHRAMTSTATAVAA